MSFWVYSYCGNMTSYCFLRWRPRSLNTTSGFVFVDVLAFRRSKSINKPNFVDINGQHYINLWLYGWEITISCLEKQTYTILEFYLRSRSPPFFRNLHFILHQPAKFRPNRSTHCEHKTSYRFIKMAAVDAEYYFRFRICWYRCLQKVLTFWRQRSMSKPAVYEQTMSSAVYEQTKFRRHVSIDGWLIPFLKNKRLPYWNSTSGFDLDNFP